MTRRELLYDWLRCAPGWHKMDDIIALFSPFYAGLPGHDGGIRRTITADIAAINESPDYPGVIISGNKGIKHATTDEAAQYACSVLAEAFRMVRRARAIQRKVGLDGKYTADERRLLDIFIARNFGGIKENL